MKNILLYLRKHLRETAHPGFLVFFLALNALLLYLNYNFDIEDGLIRDFRREWVQLPIWFGWYLLPYLLVVLAWLQVKGEMQRLCNPRLWYFMLGGIALLALNSWFYQYEGIANSLSPNLYEFASKCLWNLRSWFLLFLPLYLFYRFRDRSLGTFYGWSGGSFDYRPWLLILLLLLPLVLIASFQPDFLQEYPSYEAGSAEIHLGVSPWLTSGFFQLCYGLDFATVELFFRGFLVIGMLRFLGKGAIYPMVALYCVIHFGKPMGEAISSIFGGYILGVVALSTKNIWGGILVHVGLAWMMELAAYAQKYLFA